MRSTGFACYQAYREVKCNAFFRIALRQYHKTLSFPVIRDKPFATSAKLKPTPHNVPHQQSSW